jgi:hypothetical protein
VSNDPTPSLPGWQSARLVVLLDALEGVALYAGERASLTWLAGFEACTVENLAAVVTRARQADPVAEVSDLPTTGDLVKNGP